MRSQVDFVCGGVFIERRSSPTSFFGPGVYSFLFFYLDQHVLAVKRVGVLLVDCHDGAPSSTSVNVHIIQSEQGSTFKQGAYFYLLFWTIFDGIYLNNQYFSRVHQSCRESASGYGTALLFSTSYKIRLGREHDLYRIKQ